MCGIAFKYNKNGLPQALVEAMNRCLQAQSYRGPDETGLEAGDRFVIGHNRLSIVDLSGSRQPMASQCGRYLLAFNGEIYNYKALRAELAGWSFVTHGDTEVLLAGLVLQGDAFLSKMEGMWAFVLWDLHEQKALFSRDRFGKKPLFFEAEPGALHIASELGALRQLTEKRWLEDRVQRAHFFKFGYMEPGQTIYSSVKELLPGEMATWTPRDGLSRKRYYQLRVAPFIGSQEDAKEQLRCRLIDAVKKRMVADVEVGVFLSGGIDSSLVSSIAVESTGRDRLKAFSIGFADTAYDESQFFRQMAQLLGVKLHERVIETLDPLLLKKLITLHLAQPFHDSSILPTWLVSNLAGEHVKVVLTGDGADELFCGYERYRAQALFALYRKIPKEMRLFVRRWVRRFDEPLAHHSRSLLKKMRLFVEADERYEEELPYRGSRYFSRQQMQLLLGAEEPSAELPLNYHLSYGETIDNIKQMMLSDIGFYMPQDILVKVDRASMANSLEARSPFLDSAVAELAVSLPTQWLLSFHGNKKFLRNTFRSRLPDSLWFRRKQGFAVPLGAWFHGSLGAEFEQMLMQEHPSGMVDIGMTTLLEHRSKRKDNGYRLWLLYVYILWRREQGLL